MVSLCEIGSVARRQSDVLSDKDLLAVGNLSEVDIATSSYRASGWNIAHYSRLEFDAMSRSHSLFVQHVKQDGRLLRDDQDFLQTTLKNYKPSYSYTKQLMTAIKPIQSFGELEPSYWGKLFQADILYVAVRNACILHRATVAKPEFDFKSLIIWICDPAGLTLSEQKSLLNLRSLKHAYRARSMNMDVSSVSEAASAARKLASYWLNCGGATLNVQETSNGYFEVRALEGQLVRTVGPIYMDKLSQYHDLAELWSTICSTDPYKPRPPHLRRWSKSVSNFLTKRHFN